MQSFLQTSSSFSGKSKLNEDQASYIYDELTRNPDEKPIKYFYFGLFDGHGGPGVAIKCAKELHHIIHEGQHNQVEKVKWC